MDRQLNKMYVELCMYILFVCFRFFILTTHAVINDPVPCATRDFLVTTKYIIFLIS